MKLSVIGCGRWGSFIAWYLNTLGRHEVTLYGRQDSSRFNTIKETRQNGYLKFDDKIRLTSDLKETCAADITIISIGAQGLRGLLREINALNIDKEFKFVLCMKGLEIGSGKRLSVIVDEEMNKNCKTAVWLGPGHVQDFTKGVCGCMVIDSVDSEYKKLLVNELASKLIRFYYGNDMIGNEVGAAIKNVVGIAAGFLDGVGMTALKGALTTRGAYEVSRLIDAMGGNPRSAYGLCHLGDYAATVFSEYSHNRMFGERFIKGESYDKLAEGYYTVEAVMQMEREYGVHMPICEAVHSVLFKNESPDKAIEILMSRSLKHEYWDGHK